MKKLSKRVSNALLILVVISIIAGVLDNQLNSGQMFVKGLLNYADDNEVSLSILLSSFLFVAYLMQYLVQDTQAELASRQERLMEAGYTPIIGVTDRDWGKRRHEGTTEKARKANELFLDLVNDGNSTARDLRLWIGISYKNPGASNYIASSSVPLQRTEEGTWWPTDVGGAISESDSGSTEFKAEPKLLKVSTSGLIKSKKETEKVSVKEALTTLNDQGVEEISLLLKLEFTTATGNENSIELAAFKEQISKLDQNDWMLYNCQEVGTEKLDNPEFSTL